MREDWMRLCALLHDDAEVQGGVARALGSTGEAAGDVDPWLVLIDELDQSGALAYLDQADSGWELYDVLGALPLLRESGIRLDALQDVDTLEPAIARANEVLAEHGLGVVHLDEDSEDYPLVVVKKGDVAEIVAITGRLERTVTVYAGAAQ
ncbi:MAG TPA: hypothetical protein VIR30_08275 [Nocardioides sp.]